MLQRYLTKKMHTDISDGALKPIKAKSEEKNLSEGQSGEIPVSNSSGEVYYRDASVAIAFRWESQPGTPKVNFLGSERPLPPLTPPPSYLSSPAKRFVRKPSKTNIFSSFLPRLNLRKNQLQSSSTSSFSSSSSSSSSSLVSVPSSPFISKSPRKQRFSSPRLSFESRADEDDSESPVSTLCFVSGRRSSIRSRGCSPNVMKLLLREFS